MSRPVKVYKSGKVECAIFSNEKFGGFNFKFQKSYKGQDGQWKNSDYFSDTDMGDLDNLVRKIQAGRIKEKGVSGEQVQNVFQNNPAPVAQPPVNSGGPENFVDDMPDDQIPF